MQAHLRALTQALFLSGVLAGLAVTPQSVQAQNPQSDVPPPAARLARLQGQVSVEPNGVDNWGGAGNNQPIGAGDRVYSDRDGQGELQASGVRAYFGPNTDLTLTNIDDRGVELGIASGSAIIVYDDIVESQSLFISTPNGGVTLEGRGNFRIDVYPDEGATIVTDSRNSDDLLLNGAGNFNYTIYRGQSIQLSGTNPVYAQPVEPAPEDEFGHWAGNIESQRANSLSGRYVNPGMPGYDELDNAGEWQGQSEYGPIWFPRVEAGWAPYHNGHWVNRPFYGWTWVADEPWGAAPFHYGRWVQMGGRWGWIPGPREGHPVWSPAQVVFAGGINIGGVGVSVWFPLGPGEPYKPWYPCSPQYIDRVNISNIRETNVIHVQKTYVNIVNVTNVTNITYVNRTSAAAMRPEDFAAGHNAKTNLVRVDARQIEHIQPAPPAVKPPAQPLILRPVVKPVKVADVRPILINQKGQQAPAAPHAQPIAATVPVKVAPAAPKPVPGHAAIGAVLVNNKAVTPAPAAPTPTPVAPARPVPPPARVTPAPAPITPVRPVTPAEKTPTPPPAVKPQPVVPPVKTIVPEPPPARPLPPATRPVTPEPRPNPSDLRPNPKDDKKKDDKKKDDKRPPQKPE